VIAHDRLQASFGGSPFFLLDVEAGDIQVVLRRAFEFRIARVEQGTARDAPLRGGEHKGMKKEETARSQRGRPASEARREEVSYPQGSEPIAPPREFDGDVSASHRKTHSGIGKYFPRIAESLRTVSGGTRARSV